MNIELVVFSNGKVTFEYENVVNYSVANDCIDVNLFGGFDLTITVGVEKFIAGYKRYHEIKYRDELNLGLDAL